jgi:hypothetical protein
MFQMLASTLSSIGQTGKAPNVVPLLHVYGPDEIVDEAGPNQGQVSVNVVISAGASLANRLQDQHWTAGPNMIPAWTEVAGLRLNASQMLRLMADAILAPSRDSMLTIRLANMLSPAGEMYPRSGPRADQGTTWTFKPEFRS